MTLFWLHNQHILKFQILKYTGLYIEVLLMEGQTGLHICGAMKHYIVLHLVIPKIGEKMFVDFNCSGRLGRPQVVIEKDMPRRS